MRKEKSGDKEQRNPLTSLKEQHARVGKLS